MHDPYTMNDHRDVPERWALLARSVRREGSCFFGGRRRFLSTRGGVVLVSLCLVLAGACTGISPQPEPDAQVPHTGGSRGVPIADSGISVSDARDSFGRDRFSDSSAEAASPASPVIVAGEPGSVDQGRCPAVAIFVADEEKQRTSDVMYALVQEDGSFRALIDPRNPDDLIAVEILCEDEAPVDILYFTLPF